jgi:multicomponent K+:H+ antiporter subunit E
MTKKPSTTAAAAAPDDLVASGATELGEPLAGYDVPENPAPHWGMGVFLGVAWLLLQRSIEPLQVALAVTLGIALPWVTRSFWPEKTPVSDPAAIATLFLRMSYDIVIANIEVARLILDSPKKLQPRFFLVPVDLTNDLAIAILASCISLTPGTVTVEVRGDRKHLRVHGIHVPDEAGTVRQIKERYEAPLARIFR